jgi:hypothetical protein
MNNLYNLLGVSNEVREDSKTNKESKKFTKFGDTAPPYENYKHMADLLELPTAQGGYHYLLVVCDISGNGHFDIEPMKSKSADTVLKAMKKMYTRKYLKLPYFSISTDKGREFEGVFNRFLSENEIYHKVAIPKRKTQNSVVESLNRILGRLIFAYLNQKEIDTKKEYRNWIPIVSTIREELNKFREKNLNTLTLDNVDVLDIIKKPKFKVNDLVYYKLNESKTFLNKKLPGNTFREGDKRWEGPTKIKKILIFPGLQPYRYLIDDNSHASFTEEQLKRA